jgi:hypothetical protein
MFFADGSLFIDSFDNEGGNNVHVSDGVIRARLPFNNIEGSQGSFVINRTGPNISGIINGTSLYSSTNMSPLMTVRIVLQNYIGSDVIHTVFDDFSISAPGVPNIPEPSSAALFLIALSLAMTGRLHGRGSNSADSAKPTMLGE